MIAHSKAGTIKLANGDIYEIRDAFEIDKRRDLAIIAIRAADLPLLPLGRSSTVEVGQGVYTVSNPLGSFENTFSQGIVSGKRRLEGFQIFQISAPISDGSSGAPLLDQRGEVIGVVVGRIPEEQNLNFAVPIDYVRGMLTAKDSQPFASVYEPESEKALPAEEPTPATTGPVTTSAVTPHPSEEFRSGSLVYLEKKLYQWRLTGC